MLRLSSTGKESGVPNIGLYLQMRALSILRHPRITGQSGQLFFSVVKCLVTKPMQELPLLSPSQSLFLPIRSL